ncbi:MAG: carboxy terminal-processing peptidase [Deltaproteobacteria bacterium]|nr:carboxy terminal-processing peptidase [Deltaproteobacteria bacterium]
MKRRLNTLALVLALALSVLGASRSLGERPSSPAAKADATEANVVRITATLLAESQFSHHPIDRDLAAKWLDRYLDALDSRHALFLQSDLEEFAGYLPALTGAADGKGGSDVARAVFARFLERMERQVAIMTAELRSGAFVFTGHDRYSLDWEHAPYPRDLAAARALWRQRLRADYLQEKLADKQPAQIVKRLARRYDLQLRTMKGLRRDEILKIYLDSLAHVYDPHSNYLGREEMEDMAIGMNLSLVGIGAKLQLVDGYCTIRELIPGGPGVRSGKLKPGDRIIAVAQGKGEPVDVVDLPLGRTVQMIRGRKGTVVALTILPAGAGEGAPAQTVALVRDEIKLEEQAAKAFIVDLPGKDRRLRLGVLDLPSFYAALGAARETRPRSATADAIRLLDKLTAERVRGLVLDLRHNGGGALDEAIRLTGLFLRKGPVVQTRDLRGQVEVSSDSDPTVQYDGPLVLLASRLSASASEILAGALQDYGRAVLVGDSATFGKGTVQDIVPLGPLMDEAGLFRSYDPGALLLTVRKFYRPSGASTQLRGVASDIVLPSPSDLADVSESSLSNPLPWDSIPSARYERLDRARPHVGALAQSSAKRIERDRGFALLAQAIARVRADAARKSVSLNEAERRQELAKSKSLAKALKEDRRKRRARLPRIHPITLANASRAGLPPPLVLPVEDANEGQDAAHTDDVEGVTAKWSPADDIILDEATRILADYVRRLEAKGE